MQRIISDKNNRWYAKNDIGQKQSMICKEWLYTKEVSIITEKYGLKVQVYADDHQLYIDFKKDDDSDIQMTTDLVQ